MKKVITAIDNWIVSIINRIVAVGLIILTFIVFIQVLARYVFNFSIGGAEELPVYIMIVSVWLTAAVLARKDEHVKLEIIPFIIKNKTALKVLTFILNLIVLASILVFTYLSFDYVKFGVETGDTTAGLEFPLWWLTSFILISGVLMAVYYIFHLYKNVKELGKWN